jgi:hypothetical protein
MSRRSESAPHQAKAASRARMPRATETGLRVDPEFSKVGVCDSCGSGRTTHIAMTLTDGTPVRFTSCQDCEFRCWQDESGDSLALAGVLDRTRKVPVAGR